MLYNAESPDDRTASIIIVSEHHARTDLERDYGSAHHRRYHLTLKANRRPDDNYFIHSTKDLQFG